MEVLLDLLRQGHSTPRTGARGHAHAHAHVACEYRVDPDFTATDQIVDHRVTIASQGAHVDLTLARVQTSAKFKATYHVFWSTEPSDAAGACKAVG